VADPFEDFVAARGQALWRSAWLLVGDSALAEDLVQEALTKAWPRYAAVTRHGGSFEAYVRRVLVTTYVSWWRRKWRGEESHADPSANRPVVDEAHRADLRQDVLRALSTLPRRQRAVVVLRYFEDLTERETADRLGCSVGSVKTHQSRALRILRSSPRLVPGSTEVHHDQ
jgi:RNA polymerase sigma-70 factor (sigma-E family)